MVDLVVSSGWFGRFDARLLIWGLVGPCLKTAFLCMGRCFSHFRSRPVLFWGLLSPFAWAQVKLSDFEILDGAGGVKPKALLDVSIRHWKTLPINPQQLVRTSHCFLPLATVHCVKWIAHVRWTQW